jgi:hypothetical protein
VLYDELPLARYHESCLDAVDAQNDWGFPKMKRAVPSGPPKNSFHYCHVKGSSSGVLTVARLCSQYHAQSFARGWQSDVFYLCFSVAWPILAVTTDPNTYGASQRELPIFSRDTDLCETHERIESIRGDAVLMNDFTPTHTMHKLLISSLLNTWKTNTSVASYLVSFRSAIRSIRGNAFRGTLHSFVWGAKIIAN